MISRRLKSTYYLVFSLPMRINGALYKKFRCPRSGLKVHLGPGQKNYIEGWINVDANFINARCDVWTDFAQSLPFPDNSVDLLYSHHVMEHLPDTQLQRHLSEIYRVLREGGGLRIGVPHLGNACHKYVQGDHSWFSDFPDKRLSIGGRFTNFIFCRGEHLTALDESYLTELARLVGFTDIKFCLPTKETTLDELGVNEDVLQKEWESDFSCPHTLIMEAKKQVAPRPVTNAALRKVVNV